MNPKKIWANYAVNDVALTRKFYTAIGFRPNSGHDGGNELASFLFGENDFVIHFFRRDRLKEAMVGELSDLSKGNEIIFTLWADSREDADKWAIEIKDAGGRLLSEPAAFGPGYYGFVFADPDGHKWNVFNM